MRMVIKMIRNKTYKCHIACVLSDLRLLQLNMGRFTKADIDDSIDRIINNINIRSSEIK